jgi:serine/threonine-protein kinase ATR
LRKDWNTYPHSVTIQEFTGIPKVIYSLAQPKRITCRGTDGENYMFLLKQEKCGDMRKEGRVMEICELVNRLISTHPEGKKK